MRDKTGDNEPLDAMPFELKVQEMQRVRLLPVMADRSAWLSPIRCRNWDTVGES